MRRWTLPLAGAAGASAVWVLATRPAAARPQSALGADPHLAAAVAGRPAAQADRQNRYPAPAKKADAAAWPRVGRWWLTQRPGDSRSPRVASLITEPSDGVRTLDGAFALFQRETGFSLAAAPRFEPFESWRRFNGTEFRAALAETRLGGAPGVAYVVLTRTPKDRGQFRVWAFEMPRETFVAWGGIARAMVLFGDLPSVDVIPAARRAQIANAPFGRQVAFHEATVDRVYNEGVASLMASQLAATQLMTQMNYNLLFGKPMDAPVYKQR